MSLAAKKRRKHENCIMPAFDVECRMIIKVANNHRHGNEVHLKISVCRSSVGPLFRAYFLIHPEKYGKN